VDTLGAAFTPCALTLSVFAPHKSAKALDRAIACEVSRSQATGTTQIEVRRIRKKLVIIVLAVVFREWKGGEFGYGRPRCAGEDVKNWNGGSLVEISNEGFTSRGVLRALRRVEIRR
jgi:hypothetical protein